MNEIEKTLQHELKEKELLYPYLSGLSGREKTILEMRSKPNKKTLKEIGEKFDLTKERIRQLEERAERKIEEMDRIIKQISEELLKYVFTEEDVEDVFLDYLKETEGKDLAKRKIKWQSFNRKLWEYKMKKNDEGDN